jgi:hypothetical protein
MYRKIIIGGPCQRLPVLDVGRLSNHAMPQLFDHVSEHHPDENFIFH